MTKVYIHDTRFHLVNTEINATKNDVCQVNKDLEVSTSRLEEYIDHLLVGSVTAFAMPTPPEGWLECNGQEVSRIIYARLFGRIGSTFGDGDGETTFNLPDLRGVFIRGWDADGKHDPERRFGTYQADQMQSHTHLDLGHSHNGITDNDGTHDHSGSVKEDGGHNHAGSTGESGEHNHQVESTTENAFGDKEGLGVKNYWSKDRTWTSSKVKDSGKHSHSISTSGYHSHALVINSSDSHQHRFSTGTNHASLGEPVSNSSSINVKFGAETRSKNVALALCIKY